jgi:hypothetical protein
MTDFPADRRKPRPHPGAARMLAGALLALSAASAVAGCGLYQPVTAEDRDASSACNVEADRVFAAQNRYQLSERDQSNSPYAGNTLPSNPTAGLSDRYQEGQYVDNCLARSAAGQPAGPTATSAAKP